MCLVCLDLFKLLNVRNRYLVDRVRIRLESILNKRIHFGREELDQIAGRLAVDLKSLLNTDMSVNQLGSYLVVDQLIPKVNDFLNQVDNQLFVGAHGSVLSIAHSAARGIDLILFDFTVPQGKSIEKVIFLVLHMMSVDGETCLNVDQSLQNFMHADLPMVVELLEAPESVHQLCNDVKGWFLIED